MLPLDTRTMHLQLVGDSTSTILYYPYTVLGVQVMQEKISSAIKIFDSTENILINYAVNSPYIAQNYVGIGDLKISKTGNDEAFVTINYVPYNIRDTIATNTPGIINGFTQGELLISYFLFIFMVAGIFGFFIKYIKNKGRYF